MQVLLPCESLERRATVVCALGASFEDSYLEPHGTRELNHHVCKPLDDVCLVLSLFLHFLMWTCDPSFWRGWNTVLKNWPTPSSAVETQDTQPFIEDDDMFGVWFDQFNIFYRKEMWSMDSGASRWRAIEFFSPRNRLTHCAVTEIQAHGACSGARDCRRDCTSCFLVAVVSCSASVSCCCDLHAQHRL